MSPLVYGEAESVERDEEARDRLDDMMGAKGTGASGPTGPMDFTGLGGELRNRLGEKRETRYRLVGRLMRVETEIMALERLLG